MPRRFLFVHQNFPGQFLHVAAELARQGYEVVALGLSERTVPGVRALRYQVTGRPRHAPHDLLADFEAKVLRGSAAAQAMQALHQEGFTPDLVVGHPAWGELLHVKDVWPDVPLAVFAEYFYGARGGDWGFDPEFADPSVAARARLRMKNTVHLHALHAADGGYAPTQWQRSQLPPEYRDKFRVIFDGIDTQVVAPDPQAFVELRVKGLRLTRSEEVITFVNRNLEPYRGFHVFMRALPAILRERPQAHVVLVGGNDVSYGSKPRSGNNWREVMLREVGHLLPRDRVHFVGKVPYGVYRQLLQVSSCHVYLTYPFVLSWSCLEAMATGCVVVGSRTPPVEEVIAHGHNGLLVDFFDVEGLARQVCEVLADRPRFAPLGEAARRTVVERYDLRTVCLPQQVALLMGLAGGDVRGKGPPNL